MRKEAFDHYEKRRYRDAEQRSLKLFKLAQDSKDINYQVAALLIAGNSQLNMEEYQKSVRSFSQILKLPQDSHNEKSVQGMAYGGIGNACICLGEHTRAIGFLKKYFEIAQQRDDKLGQGAAYCSLGKAYEGLRQYKMAIDCHQKYLEISKELDDKSGQGCAYSNLGSTYDSMELYTMAIHYHQKHLDIAEQLGDKPGHGQACGNLGNTYSRLGMYQTAIEYHHKHLDIAKQLNDAPRQGAIYTNLGNAHSCLGEYEAAIKYHREHLKTANQLDDTSGQIAAHGDLGINFARSGQLGLACSHFSLAGTLVRQLEAQLADGQWRQHLLTFGEPYAIYLDWWVVSAARSGDMAEALRLEERRRSRSELTRQADVQGRQGRANDDASVDNLKAMARSADASFMVVMKVFDDALLTWVLSGETGELLYAEIEDIAGRRGEIAEWVNYASFVKWTEWQRVPNRLREWETHETRNGRPVERKDRQKAFEWLKKDALKGDADEESFRKTVSAQSDSFEELQNHFSKKAYDAMGKLSKLLWEPIVEKCRAVKECLEGDVRHSKPVRVHFILFPGIPSLVFFLTRKL